MSDGQPTDEWKVPAAQLRKEEENGSLICYPIAIGLADIDILGQMSGVNQPVRLKGLAFKEMFQWLSASVTEVSRSGVGNAVELPPVAWGEVK